jgi:hypothetical protein
MAQRGVKKRDYERLDDATISRVVSLLEQETPITKKTACEILHISYNTARLGKIIQEYKDQIEYTKKRMRINRGKPFSDYEIQDMVIRYLSGESMSIIAKSMYRSLGAVKAHITKLGLPERSKTADYWNPDMMPDEMVAKSFEVGEYVWAARYNCMAQIKGTKNDDTYLIWVFGKYNQFARQPLEELGKLDILKQFKFNHDEFETTDNPGITYRLI